MKKVLLVSLLFLTACVRNFATDFEGGNIQVKIPWYSSEKNTYELQDVSIAGIQDMKTLSGLYARFFFSPSLSGGKISGARPQAHFFRNQAGTYIAKDHTSLQMATAYAVMEKMAGLDRDMGLEGVNQYPRTVGVNVVQLDHGLLVRNNAYYDGKTDSILLLAYSTDNLPIPFNIGILAHEHFHSLFYKLVIQKIREEKKTDLPLKDTPHDLGIGQEKRVAAEGDETEKEVRDVYVDVLLRGLNEGFADYWAWLFTGDPDFIALSLPSEKDSRTLQRSSPGSSEKFAFRLPEIKSQIRHLFQKSTDIDRDLVGLSYSIGTSYSRFLKAMADRVMETRRINSVQARLMVGRSVIQSLNDLKNQVNELSEVEFIRPENIYQNLFQNLPSSSTQQECELFKEYLKAVAESPDEFGDCHFALGSYQLRKVER